MRVRLLGGFSVSVGNRIVTRGQWRLRKASALVKLLALAPGHRMQREQAMDLLWPDLGRKAASNNLRQALHAARRALTTDASEGSRYLSSEDESLELCARGELWVDVDAFEEAAATARRGKEPSAYRAAIELCAGDLLPEDRYEGWAEERREGLRLLHHDLLIELADLLEGRGEYERSIEALRRAVGEEPTLEEAHAGLMRLYARLGREGEALAQYERLKGILTRELGAEPGTATRRLLEEIAADTFPRFPPAGPPLHGEPPDPSRHNLPAPRTSFVGREREIVDVKRELAMTRLLTLTGAGGSGKTRLALEVARDLVGVYPDGVWFAELAGLSEPDLVPQAVATVLGVPERPGQPITDTLVGALHGKQTMLVLDNCEHLVGSAARLVDALLDACPGLRVLATSRELLKVSGEANRTVSPLSVPASQPEPTVADLETSESARLFVERARQRNPTFALMPNNTKAVSEVCQQLAGMPLAIELAAARVGTLSLTQINRKLKGSLKLLGDGGRTTSERHRTLRGALDWSYRLLGGQEKVLFRRLSVFAGGWTLEAADAVGAGEDVELEEITDILSGLGDKSVVVADLGVEGKIRYRMLEPVRQYARERLEQSGDADATRQRHLAFFLAMAEEAEPAIEGAMQGAWLDRLDTEHDNLKAAISWALQTSEPEVALRMVAALGEFWYLRGHFGEGRRWLEEALAKPGSASAARAKALGKVSWLAILQGDLERAARAAEEGLCLEGVDGFRTAGGDSVEAELKRYLGIAVSQRGEYERAMELYEASLTLSLEVGTPRGVAVSFFLMGVASRLQGNLARAKELLEKALKLCRPSGDQAMLASILTHLGYTLLLQDDLERATVISEEAVAMLREQKHTSYLADALDNLGWAALLRGDTERAKALYAESLGLRRGLGDTLAIPETIEGIACVAGARGEAKRAARLFGAVRAMYEAIGVQQETADNVLLEPYLLAARSQLDEASWDAATADGAAMGVEEFIAYALSEGDATPAPTLYREPPVHEPSPSLTSRETEVATLVARGLTNRQIASELSISEHTAATHVGRTLKKLGLRSRAQLAAWVSEQPGSSDSA